jgi:hypothetical protein
MWVILLVLPAFFILCFSSLEPQNLHGFEKLSLVKSSAVPWV